MPQWLTSTMAQSLAPPSPKAPPAQMEDIVHSETGPLTRLLATHEGSPLATVPRIKRRHSSTPSPSPSPKPRPSGRPRQSPRIPSSPIPQGPSAYAFAANDENDAAWSTLPCHKKSQAALNGPRKPVVKQSGRFRLPLPGLQRRADNETGKTSKEKKPDATGSDIRRRVVTYLPPPMLTAPEADSDIFRDDNAVDVLEAHTPTPSGTRTPSPSKSLIYDVDTLVALPDSDSVTLFDGEDATLGLDLTELTARYPVTRKLMKEVRPGHSSSLFLCCIGPRVSVPSS
ncbi:hypothetical protein BV22DRAFT_701221 [Leucogyrophana mollusca]|uniref:Uncharacterized protein n=1 Tax=Leucogyrophana mollusca TaxID=85980 RepID=A0ACB8B859_9AGAM|nr:hypothetical protein BV22DRAFT_701221 [Leucogyrophana mollusca]